MTSRRSFFRKSVGIAGTLALTPIAQQALAEDISDAFTIVEQVITT